MQALDAQRNVIASEQINGNAAELLRGFMKNQRVASVTVGKMPLVGQEVEICGLVYSVTGRSGKQVTLKLKG